MLQQPGLIQALAMMQPSDLAEALEPMMQAFKAVISEYLPHIEKEVEEMSGSYESRFMSGGSGVVDEDFHNLCSELPDQVLLHEFTEGFLREMRSLKKAFLGTRMKAILQQFRPKVMERVMAAASEVQDDSGEDAAHEPS